MGDPALEHQFHELLCRGRHVFETLSERHDRKACVSEILAHLHRAPTVIRDFLDVVFLTELDNELLDKAIVNYVAFGGHCRALCFPHVIRNMIASDALVESFLRHPEEWEDIIWFALIARREHQHKCRDICAAGQVKACVAFSTGQRFRIHRRVAFVPCIHRHPAHALLYPLVKAQLPE